MPDIRSEVGIKPYRRFWAKVVINAVEDWIRFRDSDSLEAQKISKDAKEWLFDEKEVARPAPMSFQWVCEILNWEYRTRQNALKKYDARGDYEDFSDIRFE